MNGNSSKQVLLSVLGIAVLVIAVVGVSFAFFTYSRNGETNNELTTGSIIFHYTEGTAIKLTNQFPVSDETGKSLTATGTDNAVLDFAVSGHDGSGKGIDYTVKAYKGKLPTVEAGKTAASYAETNRFYDNEIKIMLTGSHKDPLPSGVTSNFTTGALVGSGKNNDASTAGVTIATGRITGSADVTHNFELRMWIPDSVVTIANTTTNRDGTQTVYSPADFSNMFYSLRVDVTAEAHN